jgi:hypothetical protein
VAQEKNNQQLIQQNQNQLDALTRSREDMVVKFEEMKRKYKDWIQTALDGLGI